MFASLKKVALTRNVLLPVGTDYTPPNKWVTDIHRDWNARYTWPRFVCALPREFFAAVRAELDARGVEASPQTRDMNPIYTGKDVSYIDTKQANRAAEDAVLDAERFAVFAGLLGGATYPQAALAKAWVQLAYGAHHDAITGSESDQVYLDLLTGWRDAWELGSDGPRQRAAAAVQRGRRLGRGVECVGAQAHRCGDSAALASARSGAAGVRLRRRRAGSARRTRREVGQLAGPRRAVARLAVLPARCRRRIVGLGTVGRQGFPDIANEHYRLRVDPARGGGVSSLIEVASGRELIADGGVGNELAVYDEYPAHPEAGEGPWHLLPKGPVVASSAEPASVQAYRGPLGERLVDPRPHR